MKPFGGIEQLAWDAKGENIAYTSRKKTGIEYAVSTNSDIYVYNLASKQTKNITEGMMGTIQTLNILRTENILHGKAWSTMDMKAIRIVYS